MLQFCILEEILVKKSAAFNTMARKKVKRMCQTMFRAIIEMKTLNDKTTIGPYYTAKNTNTNVR